MYDLNTDEIFILVIATQEDGHEIWPDSDFVNFCHEFGSTKKSHS